MGGLSSFAVDPQRETEGVWFQYRDGIWLKVARRFNVAFDEAHQELRAKLSEEYGSDIPEDVLLDAIKGVEAEHYLKDWAMVDGGISDDLTPIEMEPVPGASLSFLKNGEVRTVQLSADLEVRECLSDDGTWYRFLGLDSGGVDEPLWQPIVRYTPELGAKLFRDERYRDLYAAVLVCASQQQRFRLDAIKEAAGN